MTGKNERGKGARAWVERQESGKGAHMAAEQLPSSDGTTERKEEGGNWQWIGRKKGGDAWIWQVES
jgi:hypothetical protein